jgi:hypothetical protein
MADTSGTTTGFSTLLANWDMITPGMIATTSLGLLVIIIFGVQKFNEPTFQASEEQPETLFAPRFLALPRQYVNALLFYLGCLTAFFLVGSATGAKGFAGILTDSAIKPESFPLALALIIVGVIPNLKWVQNVELFFRRVAHRRAFIPEGARLMQTRLRGANFDFSKYDKPDILQDDVFRTLNRSDFDAPRNSVEHRWARFTCLIYALRQVDEGGSGDADDFGNIAQGLDEAFLSAYRPEYKRLLALHKDLEHRIPRYRKGTRSDSDIDDLVDALQRALRRTYMFVGCAVRLKYSIDARAIDALARFGFEVKPLLPAPSIFYLIRWAALAMPALVFLTVMATTLVGLAIPQDGSQTLQQTALKWAFSGLLIHGSAAWAAYKLRGHLKLKSEWEGRPLQIVTAGIVGAFVGFAAMLGFVAAFGTKPLDFGRVLGLLPWMALPGTTGAFTAFFLDTPINVDRGRRVREALIQGFVTALATYLILTFQGDPNMTTEFKYFIIFVTLLIGGSLGFFLPHCHRELERAPMAVEVQSRIEEFRWEAARILDDDAKVDEWLNQPAPSLRSLTPMAAAKSAAGSDRVRAMFREMRQARRGKPPRLKGREARKIAGGNGNRADGRLVDRSAVTIESASRRHPGPIDAPLQPDDDSTDHVDRHDVDGFAQATEEQPPIVVTERARAEAEATPES